MKINLFKIPLDNVPFLKADFKEKEYKFINVTIKDYDEWHFELYINQNRPDRRIGWLENYENIIDEEDYEQYINTLGSEILSGGFLIESKECAYIISHGQAHFVIRKYCAKEFGLDLAERIASPNGLKMTHSQSFTSNSKKEITSYTNIRELDDLKEFGEVYNYVKGKTVNKNLWGENAEFGESVRLNLSIDSDRMPGALCAIIKMIENTLSEPPKIKLPRYRKVTDEILLKNLNQRFDRYYQESLTSITQVDADDYWMNGVSFYFSSNYKYAVCYKRREVTDLIDNIDATYLINAIQNNSDLNNCDYSQIGIAFYDEDGIRKFTKKLRECFCVTLELNNRYFVYFDKGWVEFSESYIEYIKDQIDNIQFKLQPPCSLNENDMIAECMLTGKYIQLHKDNVYIGKYCIEKADLMDDDNIIMVKKCRNTSDLVYLVKQAKTSLKLSYTGELGKNVFRGRNVCLWMLLDRKELTKLSDLKSFHLLDALNEFKHAVTDFGLIPVVWVSLAK